VLRARLAELFRSLAELAERSQDPAGAARYRVERHFVQAIDALGDPSPAGLAATGEHVKLLLQSMRAADLLGKDLRGHVVSSLHFLELGQPDAALQLGGDAQKLGVPLRDWQRELLGDKLAPLGRIDSWREPLLRR
jgi:hypothetical protein